MALEKINLEKWKFALGEDITCLKNGRQVNIPHTWNIEEGTEEFWGIGWYEYCFTPDDSWKEKRVQVLFGSVYHDAYVYLNEEKVGEHKNSGYTPFSVELTNKIRFGRENRLVVKADNRFSNLMLPYGRSFDWANDGGMIRQAQMMITGKNRMKNIHVTAHPVIITRDERQDQGSALFGVQAQVDGESKKLFLEWEVYEGCDGSFSEKNAAPICKGIEECFEGRLEINGRLLEHVNYWHFDSPNLYTLKMTLKDGAVLQDEQLVVFGFRDFHIQGRLFYLNGEQVRLTGTEWMPGSDPAYGMAETKEQLEKMLRCLKRSNSILTRFHWQQDDWVYDWCDRHGMLVQEEVPFWGADPLKAGTQQWKIFTEQIEEMICAHRNHPSIIMWGVGNELDSQCEETIQYIKHAVAYTHRLDPERPANYVTNSIYKNPALDGTTDGDVLMINDYIGTWHEGLDQYGEWDAIVRQNPDKPMIPSEFGLCEPVFSGGDARRNEIFLEKMDCYRKYPNIAGTIYFCLNDYRTQKGEQGEGRQRRRVHGSADLCGNSKPSYWTIQKEYSPLLTEIKEGKLTVHCRADLPSYTVKGYYIKIREKCIPLPVLKPGESWSEDIVGWKPEDKIEIYRPNGDCVLG